MRVALAALSCCALAACSGGASSDATSPPTGTTSPTGRADVHVTKLDTRPVGVADVGGTPWTALLDAGAVRTDDDVRIDVGRAPLRLVDTPAGVWVSVISDGAVVRIDPATAAVDRRVRLRPSGSEPEGVAWDGTSLWVVDQAHDRVVQLSPAGRVLADFPVDAEPRLVSAGERGVWVTSYGGSSLTLVRHGVARTVALTHCVGPQGVAEVAGRVWVACTLSNTAVALDVRSLKQVAEVGDLTDADAVVVSGDTAYVVGQSGPTVYTLDAATGDLTGTLALDDAPGTDENVGAAIVGDDLVVTHPERKKIYTLPLP